MLLKEVQMGEVFTIENTPSYPKLKLNGGYVDMRDEIVNKSGNNNERECSILPPETISKMFGESVDDVKNWIEDMRERYRCRVYSGD